MNVAPLFWCFIVRFYHPRRSTRMLVSVGADICIGRRRCINRRVWHPCHTHAATPTPSARSHLHAADCVGSVKSRKRHAPKGQKHIAQGSALPFIHIFCSLKSLEFCIFVR